jgi:hypothetical protein
MTRGRPVTCRLSPFIYIRGVFAIGWGAVLQKTGALNPLICLLLLKAIVFESLIARFAINKAHLIHQVSKYQPPLVRARYEISDFGAFIFAQLGVGEAVFSSYPLRSY